MESGRHLRDDSRVSVGFRRYPCSGVTYNCCKDRLSPSHHSRVVRRAVLPIGAIRPIEPVDIHLTGRPQHRPHEVVSGSQSVNDGGNNNASLRLHEMKF